MHQTAALDHNGQRYRAIRIEVFVLPENGHNALAEQVRQAREQLRRKLRDYAGQLEMLQRALNELCDEHERLESDPERQLSAPEEFKPRSLPIPFGAVLVAVENLITATLPKQVFEKLTEEAYRMGVRAVVFEVRSRAAWGASAHGFGPQLTGQVIRSLVVPLSVDTPFRQIFESGEPLMGDTNSLKKNPNVLNRLRPDSGDSILLLPIRSAGAVSGIFYADSGGRGDLLPADALKLLTEFAGAQLDRMRALGGKATAATGKEADRGGEPESPEELERPAEVAGLVEQDAAQAPLNDRFSVSSSETCASSSEAPLPPPPSPLDVSQLSEADQKLHKDARRFAKLLVSEIELYHKTTVAEGRESKDLYRRMKLVIDRSRQAFDRRFGKTLGKEFDYFHDELVRTLAANDPALLGSDYPGPSA